MVGEQDEDRAVPDPRALQPRDEAPHHLVGVGHLAEVRLARVAREERLRRLVGRVRVVEVDPGEELLRLHALEPREREVHHLVALLLDGAEVHDLVLREVEAVGVVVEALVEAPARVEHPGADEGPGRVAGLLQPLGERRRLLLDEEAAVVADAVVRGDEPGEDRRVRGKRQRHRGRGLLEEDALGRHRVDVGRLDAPEAVAARAGRRAAVSSVTTTTFRSAGAGRRAASLRRASASVFGGPERRKRSAPTTAARRAAAASHSRRRPGVTVIEHPRYLTGSRGVNPPVRGPERGPQPKRWTESKIPLCRARNLVCFGPRRDGSS